MTMSMEIVNTSNHSEEIIRLTYPGYGGERGEKLLKPGESISLNLFKDGERAELGVTFEHGENPQAFYLQGKQVFPRTSVGFS